MSLMVEAQYAAEAVALAKTSPGLGVGLHFVAIDKGRALCDLNDITAIEKELRRQYQRFCDLLGRPPTHLDSHHHVHLTRRVKTGEPL